MGVIHLSLNCASDFAQELYADGTFVFSAMVGNAGFLVFWVVVDIGCH